MKSEFLNNKWIPELTHICTNVGYMLHVLMTENGLNGNRNNLRDDKKTKQSSTETTENSQENRV